MDEAPAAKDALSAVGRWEGPLPVLDLGPFRAGESGAAGRLAAAIGDIQERIGFYAVVNHGVDAALVAAALDQVRAFHALPLAEKMKLKVDETSTGYVPFGSSVYVTSPLNRNDKRDLNANFRIVRERPADHPSIRAGRRFTGPNKWPDPALLPRFRDTMLAYYQAMEDLGRALLPVYARALGLPVDYFDPYFTDPTWLTRNVHYPLADAAENQFAASPHRDHGFLSLLPLSEVPGLEFQDAANGDWLAAPHVPGAIIVNAGEFMNMWTNGRFMATPHRVVPPRRERHIIAFFYNPNWDVVSEPLPTCVGPGRPASHAPVRFLDHLCEYVDRNYARSSGGAMDDAANL